MRIGILTFHWGTNYGGVLQAFCLQEYLIQLGYEVKIIDYKPGVWKNISRLLAIRKKESMLAIFRKNYLKTSRRYFFVKEIEEEINKYDVLISGSDQVLNPSFTLKGEGGGTSFAYWLGFRQNNIRKIGYSVSFGCEHYPDKAVSIASKWVNYFDVIGTREQTGLDILDQLGYRGTKCVTPDPTILLGNMIFSKLHIRLPQIHGNYTCIYMLRHEVDFAGNAKYIDELHHPLTMEEWLYTIVNAKQIITNSYHGTIMAVLSHVPFAVLLETGKDSGMNDRFFTLLGHIGCNERVAATLGDAISILNKPIDFTNIDSAISNYREVGELFLKENLM